MPVRGWVERRRAVAPRRLPPAVSVRMAAVALVFGLAIVLATDGHPAQQVIARSTAPKLAIASQTTPARPTCTHLVHLGDSNLGIVAADFRARYDSIGINAVVDVGLGRGAAIVDDGTTALDAIAHYQSVIPSTRRCWIIELSDADAVDAATHHTDPAIPIRAMARALHGDPVLWITPVLASATTEWSPQASTAYNQALIRVAADFPNITVMDWQDTAVQHLDEFQPDGVHYTRPLYDLLISQVMRKITTIWRLRS